MTNQRLLFVPLLAFGLASCGFDQPPPSSGPVESSPEKITGVEKAAPVAVAAPPVKQVDSLERFSKLLASGGRGYFRFDRIRTDEDGIRERRVFVEMLGTTDKEAADAASEVLQSLGYEQGRRWGDENGVRISFESPAGGRVRVLVRSREVHSKLRHEDATSSVYLTVPVVEESGERGP